MNENSYSLRGSGVKGFIALATLLTSAMFLPMTSSADIWKPEGLNMPGAWNSWVNPPANNLALASYTQVTNGRVTKDTTGTHRWQTIFSVAASGADVVGGTYNWLFTSGPAATPFQNKWSSTAATVNTLQTYTFKTSGGTDNTITLTNGKWYTMVWEDKGYVDCKAIFMETSAQPVTITGVSSPTGVNPNTPVTITVTLSAAACPEEYIFLRYSLDNWVTSSMVSVTMAGTSGTATIPGQAAGTVVSYYVLSSAINNLAADFDLCTIHYNNNSGANYSYTVVNPNPEITWANLQWPASGSITTGDAFDVYGRVLIPGLTGQSAAVAGLQAWVGYSLTNTDPSTWTNWVPAVFSSSYPPNDEYKGDIGTGITAAGTYYYATRFRYNTGAYVYGGYSAIGGGYWDGTANVSGTLTVTDPQPVPDFDWVNLQWPGSGLIAPGENFDVYAQDYIAGVTGGATPAAGVQAWIGYSTGNTNPDTWTTWVPATYQGPDGNNDEYKANIGTLILTEGTYYYASRFQKDAGDYYYGGYSATGGGFWDGVANISGVLTVQTAPPSVITWANLQYPDYGSIILGGNYAVYGQVYAASITGTGTASPRIESWIGYSTDNSNPDTWTDWVPATFNTSAGSNDEYTGDIGPAITSPGTYYYATRFRLDNGAFVYGGYSGSGGGFWDGISYISGILNVTSSTTSYPVLFTIIDATQIHNNIKFKGQMNNWVPVPMLNMFSTWTVTMDVPVGTWEWGAIQDDGSHDGIWLIDGPNLVMTVAEDGTVTGTVTYTTYITSLPEWAPAVKLYPNPTEGPLFISLPLRADRLRITDMKGKVCLQQEQPGSQPQLNIGNLVPGIYLLEVTAGNEIMRYRIVKSAK